MPERADARDELVDRFAVACEGDRRIRAAYLGGSVGSGVADLWADIDLGVVIGDDDYDGFFEDRHALLDRLGTPVFRETLHLGFDVLAFIMDTGVDGELLLHRVSDVADLHAGPIRLVIDRAGLLQGKTFPHAYPTDADVAEELPVVLNWFWRDALHFARAIARERPWTAYAFLEKLRGGCQYLITQSGDATGTRPSHFVPFDGYEALDHLPASADLDILRDSLCVLERGAMMRSARMLISLYQRLAPAVAAKHGCNYPARAEAVVLDRLDLLSPTENP